MTLVIDASVALKMFVDEPGSDDAVRLLSSGEPLVAPDLVVAELCNAAWRLWRLGELTERQTDIIAEKAPMLFAERVAHEVLSSMATHMAVALAHPAYDCFYLALAELRDCQVVTADRRFSRRVHGSPWAHRLASL